MSYSRVLSRDAKKFFNATTEDTAMSDKSTTEKARKPAEKFRDGAIEVAVWHNEIDKGPWFSVTSSRSYKLGEDWKQSDNFGKDDILPLSKLLGQAHSWILNQQQQQRAQQAA